MKTIESPTNPHAAGKAAHTDTPFHVGQISGRLQAVYGQLGEQVADCSGYLPHQESNANAAFIVRACNSHAALVEAVERLLNQVTGPAQVYGDGIGNDGRKTGLSHWEFNELRDERIAFARAAIARATGQGGGE